MDAARKRNDALQWAYLNLQDAEEYARRATESTAPPALAEKMRAVLAAITEASSLTAQAIREAQRYLD